MDKRLPNRLSRPDRAECSRDGSEAAVPGVPLRLMISMRVQARQADEGTPCAGRAVRVAVQRGSEGTRRYGSLMGA